MFGKWKRQRLCRIVVRGAAGEILMDADEANYTLSEAAVVALSVEFFNDPEPCEIHRAAVRHRAVQQLREACPSGVDVPADGLTSELRALLPEGAATVRFEEAG